MDVSREQAQEALAAVQQVTKQTRNMVARGGGAHMLIVWGCVWFFGFLGSHFLQDERQGLIWGVLNLVGIIATIYVSLKSREKIRDNNNMHLGILWVSLMGYAVLLIFINPPETPAQIVMHFVLTAMFGYVVMGLWFRASEIGWTGVIVTVLSVLGYFWLPEYFFLWMAVLGGGTLMGGGIYILRRWK